jgi:hypothetical protein
MKNYVDAAHGKLEPQKACSPVSPEEVLMAIKSLNNNKAADEQGLTAEHLKLATPHILPPLSSLFTVILQSTILPTTFSTGILTPVLKKGKNPHHTDNYRGIVVSPIIAKTFEHILLKREQPTSVESDLQFGFTAGRSPTMASLVLTETIAENLDNNRPTLVASLDTQKAFDVVWQDSLAVRLAAELPPELWKVHTSLLENTCIKVKLDGSLGKKVSIFQGVGQGRVLSTKNYKKFIGPILRILKACGKGAYIGHICCNAPTCADDILLIATSEEELQLLFSIAFSFASQERYNIHPDKTRIIYIDTRKPPSSGRQTWSLGDAMLHLNESLTHLGIERFPTPATADTTIDQRIQCARRTAYSLLGAGAHGIGGLNTPTLRAMVSTYVTPRLLYGLESLIVSEKQKAKLDLFYKQLLRQLQGLPKRTACEALYLLFGTLPMEAILDIRTLTFFGKIISDKGSILYLIALRQLSTKSLHSNSWFVYIVKLCFKYDLPHPASFISSDEIPATWKSTVKRAVKTHWNKKLSTSAKTKSSLTLINTPADFTTHPRIWDYVELNTQSVQRARLQQRLLTSTYTLQSHRETFYAEDPTCKLCLASEESTTHLLAECRALLPTREKLLDQFSDILPCDLAATISSDPMLLTILILNPEDSRLGLSRRLPPTARETAAHLSSNACFKLISNRKELLAKTAPPNPPNPPCNNLTLTAP